MCGSSPKVVQRDPVAEAAAADRLATQKANKELAARRGSRRKSSLIANVGGSAGLSAIAQTTGKDTLG